MGEREAFGRILNSLREAALDDALWPTASALMDEALQAHGNTLMAGDLRIANDMRIYSMGIFSRGERQGELEREYLESYYPRDERLPRIRKMPDGRLTHMSELYAEKELAASALYNEFLNRLHARNSVLVRLDGPGGASIGWAVHDPVDGKDCSSARLALMERLLPHVRHYAHVRNSLAGAGALGASLAQLLEATGLGVIHLDPRGRVVEANDPARELLRTGEALFDARGLLYARETGENVALQALLASALPSPGSRGAGGSMLLRRRTGLPLMLHVNPVGRREADLLAWPVAALVLVVDPERRTRIAAAAAGEALGLTGMESLVAALLAEGRSVPEIASATGRSEGTIRTHLKNVFAKHGISRQADLMRLVLSVLDVLGSRE